MFSFIKITNLETTDGPLKLLPTLCAEIKDPKNILRTFHCYALLEMEEVRQRKDWMCPHCIEEKGINPYWICNRYENQLQPHLIVLCLLLLECTE